MAIEPYQDIVDSIQSYTEECDSKSFHRNSPSQHRSNHQADQIDDQCFQTLGCHHLSRSSCCTPQTRRYVVWSN
uniref:Uncharacterized protein n=1 Tax=Medicago truncatula TaxID=3880 RepID=I3T8M1_MEDTR|nr:unknown [Medicago truncatula]